MPAENTTRHTIGMLVSIINPYNSEILFHNIWRPRFFFNLNNFCKWCLLLHYCTLSTIGNNSNTFFLNLLTVVLILDDCYIDTVYLWYSSRSHTIPVMLKSGRLSDRQNPYQCTKVSTGSGTGALCHSLCKNRNTPWDVSSRSEQSHTDR